MEEAKKAKKTQESMTLEEITRRHWGMWVAIRVVERDEAGQPRRGTVLSHGSDRGKLRREIRGEKSACIFFAGPVPMIGGLLL